MVWTQDLSLYKCLLENEDINAGISVSVVNALKK